MKPMYILCGTREFKMNYDPSNGHGIIGVEIWEKRKHRKWYQPRYESRSFQTFDLDCYDSVEDGTYACLRDFLRDEEIKEIRRKKFENYEKKA